jgi:hypothetical protein
MLLHQQVLDARRMFLKKKEKGRCVLGVRIAGVAAAGCKQRQRCE